MKMHLYQKIVILLIGIVTLGGVVCLGQGMPNIIVTIKGQGLTIGTPVNHAIGNFSDSIELDTFRIEDLRGSNNGHYTSIQGIVYGSNGEIISGAKVFFKSNSDNLKLIGGIKDDDSDFNRYLIDFTDITEPVLLFYRNDNPNHLGYLNKYGFTPTIKLSLPKGSNDTYTVKLSYTLYDMQTTIN